MHGIDVSSHQGSVAWDQVAGSGIGFAFVKASGGSWYRNPHYADQHGGARAAGLAVGSYHYAFESSGDPFPGKGPEAEADYFLETVLGRGPILTGDMLVLDIEEGPGDMDLGAWALRWLGRVRDRVGFRPLVYTGRWFSDPHGFGRHVALSGYPLWLADYSVETTPPPPAPWSMVAFWQFSDKATIAGVAGPCDLNALTPEAGGIDLYGRPEGLPDVDPPPYVAVGPRYDPHYPAISQNDDFSCSCTSMRWALWAYSRQPSEQWLEGSMLTEGVVSTSLGLLNASGVDLAAWATRHYGDGGFHGEHDPTVSFDDVAAEAATLKHPLMIGGRNWGQGGHWTGVRGFDGQRLMLANPASGYAGITQSLSREQWGYVGPFSLVRLVHQSESVVAPVPPTVPDDPFAPWRSGIGSGLLQMMAEDNTIPAQRASTWYPLLANPADIETCMGLNGTDYRWILSSNQGFRYRPS